MEDYYKKMDSMRQQNDGVWHRVNQSELNMSKEEKWRLWILNIYGHNASMRLDKKTWDWTNCKDL